MTRLDDLETRLRRAVRQRSIAARQKLDLAAATEAIAANTVFTTHTPVPAGHDHFSRDMIERYFGAFCRAAGLPINMLLAMGRTNGGEDFNMTALAVHGSRFHNGVSRIHGGVTSNMLAPLWPDIEPHENPITHVTNGVHLPTVLAGRGNGTLRPGRHVRVANETPMANLYLSMLDRMGVQVEQHGDSNGRLVGLSDL